MSAGTYCLYSTPNDRFSEKLFMAFSFTLRVHAYIIRHYNPSIRIIDLVSHTTYLARVNFIREWQNLQFNIDSEQQFFETLIYGRFIYSQNFRQKSAETKSPKKYFLFFVFDVWPGVRSVALRLISHHTTY